MLSITETKKLLGDTKMPDKEAESIRNACYELAELALDSWEEQKRKNNFVIPAGLRQKETASLSKIGKNNGKQYGKSR